MKTPLSNSVICRSVYEVINNVRITICIYLYVIAFFTRQALVFRFFSLHLVRLSNNISKREPKILGMGYLFRVFRKSVCKVLFQSKVFEKRPYHLHTFLITLLSWYGGGEERIGWLGDVFRRPVSYYI